VDMLAGGADSDATTIVGPEPPHARPSSRVGGRSSHVVRDANRSWLADLRGGPAVRAEALAELHALLLGGARFELHRRRATLGHVPRGSLDDLANQAADDALATILTKLSSFRGASRFTTWAYRFVLFEAGVKARRRAWQGREIAFDDHARLTARDAGPSPQSTVESSEFLRALGVAVQTALTPHQREVFAALAFNGVPIDVLAERRNTTRGALYKTLHDARRKLRTALAAAGQAVP
jgi:RNA polymerase sigma-70 factor (ECF subfamily)